MKTTRLSQALLVAVIGSVALIGCKKKEEAPAPAPTAQPATAPATQAAAATVSVTGVTLGKDAGATLSTTTFAPGDSIHANVATQTSDPAAAVTGTLSATWTHVDSNQTVHEESKDFSFTGPGTTTFQISKPDGWPTGKYSVAIALNGSAVSTTEFEVR
ncbi:hypothetical protein E2F46_11930 [Luteimonas aestuarii]|uniref:Uncharacterized protein n=1 Tax=Luteimonas aestuarii TaxID=453837 RepID=A0A4R5TQT6_9GAMM|nr:hypothetical protein [Luteimonas aestuarii]TDK23069.1 hypothetical protein E2F46_11930 [Luteimonas aestuarii]